MLHASENLEHKPDESCDMSQELLLPVISVESDPGVNDQEVSKFKQMILKK